MKMIKVYGDTQSGNCYKIKLLLSVLGHAPGVHYKWIPVDILAGDTQTETFKAMNPNGKIPLLQLDDGSVLVESNAILNFLATGTRLLPTDPFQRAKVLQWQFFEQYSHEPYIAVARFINKYLGLPEDRLQDYLAKQDGGHKALQVMEQQLAKTCFLTGENFTIADISLFAYTHVAHEGGFDLTQYPHISNWIQRIQNLKNYVGMDDQ